MGWTAIPAIGTDVSVGELLTAAKINSHWSDNLRYLKGLDGAVAISDELQSVVAGGGTLTAQGTNNNSFARYKMIAKTAAGGLIDWRLLANGAGTSEFAIFDVSSGTGLERMRIDSAGNIGIGVTAPQGKLHVGNASGQGGFLQYGYSGAGPGTVTILPTGAVTAGFALSYVTKPSAGAINGSTTFLSTPGGAANLYTDGATNQFILTYVVGGSVTLTRNGALTYSGTLTLVYY